MTYEQQCFCNAYMQCVSKTNEDQIERYFLDLETYERDHIEDCWLLWRSAIQFGKEL